MNTLTDETAAPDVVLPDTALTEAALPEVLPEDVGMSPWFPANEYRPIMAGPYQCKMIGAFIKPGDEPKHMRWFNGENWSYPLQPEHETVDCEYMQPADTYFIREDADDYNIRFAWRGFNEDQEPL